MYQAYVPPSKQRGQPYRWHSFTHTAYIDRQDHFALREIITKGGNIAIIQDHVVDWIRENIPPEDFHFDLKWRTPQHVYWAFRFRHKRDAVRFKLACL